MHFIRIRNIAKIANKMESFWVIITRINTRGYRADAVVINNLAGEYGYNYGSEISFDTRRIIGRQ